MLNLMGWCVVISEWIWGCFAIGVFALLASDGSEGVGSLTRFSMADISPIILIPNSMSIELSKKSKLSFVSFSLANVCA